MCVIQLSLCKHSETRTHQQRLGNAHPLSCLASTWRTLRMVCIPQKTRSLRLFTTDRWRLVVGGCARGKDVSCTCTCGTESTGCCSTSCAPHVWQCTYAYGVSGWPCGQPGGSFVMPWCGRNHLLMPQQGRDKGKQAGDAGESDRHPWSDPVATQGEKVPSKHVQTCHFVCANEATSGIAP